MSASERTERHVITALCAATLAVAAWALATASWRLPIVGTQFPMLGIWGDLLHQQTLPGPIAAAMPVLVLLDILLAASLAFTLCLSRSGLVHARFLRRSLAAGALSALYLFVLRPLSRSPADWMPPGDVIAFVFGALAVADLVAFLAGYPRQADPTTIRAYFRLQSAIDSPGLIGRLRMGLIRGTQAALKAAHAPASLTMAFGGEEYLQQQVRNTERLLDVLASARTRWILAAVGLLGGLSFAFGGESGLAGAVAFGVSVCGPFIPMLGAQGLEINYRCGDADDRRRIAWIWLGPMIGFFTASLVFFLLMFGAAFLRGPHGEPAQMFGIDLWRLFIVSLLVFVPFVVGAFLLGLAFSIFYDGAVDPRLTIRRGAMIGFGGIVFSGLFVAIEGLVQSQVVLHLGMSAQANALTAGAVSAILFAPLRKRIEHGVDRTVERYMPVSDLAGGARSTVSVCFIDMSGYTALSERDQPEALIHAALLQKCGRSAAARCGGDLIKSLGDAVMLSFPSPQAAVEAAALLHQDYLSGAATLGVTPLPLHGGLHHGEVVVSRDGDLYGAAVNLASRLCGAAKDRQLVVSDAVRELLHDVPALALGELRLKNVQEAVRACAVEW